MKKILLISIIIIIILLNTKDKETNERKDNKEELRGIYISYIEISKYLKDKDENTSKKNINKIINNIKNINCNTIILQVRPSNDSIYYSNIFPISKYLSNNNDYPYDVLDYFIRISHKNDIKLYAWINPYRISTTEDIEIIDINNPAYKYLNTDTVYVNNGIFYNPSKKEVTDIILEGIEEVLNYDIDGILFDDYFYPNDEIDINDYKNNNKNESLEEYHLNIISNMIEKVHRKCKRKKVLFGVSPDGNIDNNYHKNYADVKKWMSNNNYIDFISPQIYYGFNNSSKPFINTLNEWNSYRKNKNINFYVSLAFYKTGKIDEYAKNGKEEWIQNNNIIMKEIIYSRNINNYNGFILYRYDNLFDIESNNKNAKEELENIKKILK